jgi:outer membrane lipoprotein-sorting protein
MKRRSDLLLLLVLTLLVPTLLPAAVGAQTLDEVLAKHAAAHGGLEKWRAVHSLIISGTAVNYSSAGPFVFEWRAPDAFRFEQTALGRKILYAHDGAVTWWVQPLLGVDQPAVLADPQATLIRRAVAFASPLVDAASQGNKVELLGKDEVDGQPALKLKMTRKDGSEETWYLDPSTGLELARLDRVFDSAGPKERWTYYSDFRTVEGLVIAHRQDQEYFIRHVALTVEKVQVNPEIDPGRFAMKVAEPVP